MVFAMILVEKAIEDSTSMSKRILFKAYDSLLP